MRLALTVMAVAAALAAITFGTAQRANACFLEPPLTHYSIEANLDYTKGTVDASETITYRNDVGQPLASLVFTVTPAHFSAFQLHKTTVDGQQVQTSLEGVILEVPLPRPLLPGQSISIRLDFSIQVPTPGNLRFGRGSDILALGNWYPVLSVWRADAGTDAPSGWARDRYVDTGDAFYTAAADYDVSLQAGQPLVVAHTGDLVKHEGSLWVFRANRIRDFALAMSPRYATSSATVGSTEVTAFYLPEHESAGRQYLKSATESLAWFNANLAQYPYSTLQVAETNTADPTWVGQEYPNVVFISNQVSAAGGGIGSYLDYLVVHEVLHQWFYGLVGNDQIYEPWVDEATVTYVTYLYFRASYPAVYEALWSRALENLELTKQTWGDRPVNSSIYDFTAEDHYFGIVYRKGAVFLDELRNAMGDDRFFAFLSRYIAEHLGGIARASDFLSGAQAYAPTSIEPIVARYFTHPAFTRATPTPAAPAATPEPTVPVSPTEAIPTGLPTSTPLATFVVSPEPTETAPLAPGVTPGSVATPSPVVAAPPADATPTAAPAPEWPWSSYQLPSDMLAATTIPWPLVIPGAGALLLAILVAVRRT